MSLFVWWQVIWLWSTLVCDSFHRKTKGSSHSFYTLSHEARWFFFFVELPNLLKSQQMQYKSWLEQGWVLSECGLGATSQTKDAWRDHSNAWQRAAICFVVLREAEAGGGCARSCCTSHPPNGRSEEGDQRVVCKRKQSWVNNSSS